MHKTSYEMSVNDYKKIIKIDCKNNNENSFMLLDILIVNYISSDTLLSASDCEKSKKELLKMKKALDSVKISQDKYNYYSDIIDKSIKICERDYNNFTSEVNNNAD